MQGEFPANSRAFHKQLSDASLPADFLEGVRFATFSMGDSGYVFYNSVGHQVLHSAPTVATVAADEPEIAAKRVHPAILTCSRPPGRCRIRGVSPLNRSSRICMTP